MKLKVKYLGHDLKYWERLKDLYLKNYSGLELEFSEIELDSTFNPNELFLQIHSENPNIVYIDFCTDEKSSLALGKLLCRNTVTRLISVVGLFNYVGGFEPVKKSISSGIRLNHFKSSEIFEVVYDPVSLLDVELTSTPPFVRSERIDLLKIYQLLRVSYIDNNFFRVETNSFLRVGDVIKVDSHPLEHLMSSKKLYVHSFRDKNLYYSRRFSYELEFIYIDNDFFSTTTESWKLYKELKKNPGHIVTLDSNIVDQVKEEMERRAIRYEPIKRKIDKWVKHEQDLIVPKRLKIMIIDDSFDVFKELTSEPRKHMYSLNFQNSLSEDMYQVKRMMPHLLVYNYDEKVNDFDKLKTLVSCLKKAEAYEPYLLICNIDEETNMLQSRLNYSHLIAYQNDIHMEEIESMAKVLDNKFHVSETKGRVFINSDDPRSMIFLEKEVNVIAMTESVMYFESDVEIPMWTVFIMNTPIRMLLTVVPHKKDSVFGRMKNCYRALINGVGEDEKTQIRRMINMSFMEDEPQE